MSLQIYSKSLCLARCRAIMALEMCNCVPFFYPFVEGPSCNPAGFECLLDFKWPIWALHICKCPSTCTEIEYTMQTVKKSSWGMKNVEESASVETATSSFRWDLIPPKVRFRRDVVFSFEDLIGKLSLITKNGLSRFIPQCRLAEPLLCLWALVLWVWCRSPTLSFTISFWISLSSCGLCTSLSAKDFNVCHRRVQQLVQVTPRGLKQRSYRCLNLSTNDQNKKNILLKIYI